MSDKNAYYVGIDFGTSNLKACTLVNRMTKYVNISKGAVKSWETNVISRKKKKDGTYGYLIGSSAIRDSLTNKTKLIYNVKSMLEHETYDVTFEDGFTTTAKVLSSEVFKFLHDRIVTQRANSEPSGTVLTVPACYSEVQKNRIRQSAEMGGIKVSGIISEPVASVFAYEEYEDFLEDQEDRIVFVLDFGGGTIDGALVQLHYNFKNNTKEVTVLASNGINYGGSDITQAMWEKITKPTVSAENMESLNSKSAYMQELLDRIEALKINMFTDNESTGSQYTCPNGKDIILDISPSDVEKLFEEDKLKEKLIAMLDRIIYDDADIDVEDITNVHFIGGGSAITYFRDILEEYFEDNDNIDELEDFDEEDAYMYVSKGASKYAEVLSNPKTSNIVFRDRCAFSIVGSDGVQYIQRNSLYGLKTIKRPVQVEPNNDGFMCMKFFQEIDGFDAKVYVGYFPFSKQPWSETATFFDMELCYDGTIKGEFYDQNNKSLGTCNMIMEDNEKC